MKDCIFCKMSKGEIPCFKIWEDRNFLAFLDIYPNAEGMTLVIPKKHYESYIFDLPKGVYLKLMEASKKVAKILEKGLPVKRIALVFEGEFVNHVHAKLYPMHNIDVSKFTNLSGNTYFKEYPGYITTLAGPKKSNEELSKIIRKIKSKKG